MKIKKIIYIVFLCYASMSFSQEQKVKEGIAVTATFTGRHCQGKNTLCSMIIPELRKKESGNTTLYNNGGVLKLVIHRNKLSSREEYKVMGKTVNRFIEKNESIYKIDYGFELDNSIANRLNLENKIYVIQKGNYPLVITKEAFVITLKLK